MPLRPLFPLLSSLFPLLVLAAACSGGHQEQPYRFTRFAMDTVVEYTVVAASEDGARSAVDRAQAELERISRLLWENDSLSRIYALNRSSGPIDVGPEVYGFLERAVGYSRATGGAFDVTIRPVLDLYPFGADAPSPPSDDALAQALRRVGYERLRFAASDTVGPLPGTEVAVGGVAKGYAVDRAMAVLHTLGIRSALVNAGGDLYALGSRQERPWVVGVRDPDDAAAIRDTLFVTDRAVATSGDYQRFFEVDGVRYHHLLDPSTGRPARRARSATVIAGTAEAADALATALFVLGAPEGLALLDRLPDAEGMVIDSAGVVHASTGYAQWRRPPAGE